MRNQLLAVGLLLTGPLASQAQALQVSKPAVFFTADFKRSTPEDSTAYCAETTFRDSVAGVSRIYYPSGKLKQYVPYSNVERGTVFGTITNWYEDGTMRSKEDYVGGQRHGELLTYYPDGSLRRREKYENGRGGVGVCYAPDGSQVPYFGYEQLPLYPGGQAGLMRELTTGILLNSNEALEMRRESLKAMQMVNKSWKLEVLVELQVGEDGRVTGAEIVKSNSHFLNNAALRAVAKLKRQFVPARLDGQVVKSNFVVPIFYTLNLPGGQSLDRSMMRRPIPFRDR
ncbi:TonB family protein [Hymenobacter arizonensis]|uniref:Protein TonB n=1 Tax=Hymenobacter arizonensis TaxID=1227077 RepID=A0A1I5TZX3_HYMAR|nr:TonB family protein [Hymenobacter arizonensis]SFP87856.1 protein TonB [Hymenobacter arizonensis]